MPTSARRPLGRYAARVDEGIDPYKPHRTRRGGCPHPPDGRKAAIAARVDADIDPYNLCSLALKHHKLWPQKKT